MPRLLSAEDVQHLAQEYNVKFVRLQFTDILGALKNIAITVEELERALHGKVCFDSAVFEGFVRGRRRDVLLQPVPSTFEVFPWRPRDGAVARLICEARTADGGEFEGCSRSVLRRILDKARERGWTLMVGPETEFFLFGTDEQGLPTTRTNDRAGFCDLTPIDLGENARRDMILTLEQMDIEVTSSHHEIAPGQHEIGLKDDTALVMADKLATFKFVVRTVAQRHGLHASFMPKPLDNSIGSGMTLNLSLWDGEKNLFQDDSAPLLLSETGRFFVGGVLKHARAITAIVNPLINSYKRLVPNNLSPVLAGWSEGNRSTMIRVPGHDSHGARLVLKSPDPTTNPYLALAVILAAGIDGIDNRIEPPLPLEECSNDELAQLVKEIGLPRNMGEALAALADDRLVQDTLGKAIYQRIMAVKQDEWTRYNDKVHQWELDEYLSKY
ncbi:MAG: glutamine synthetase family protein [Bacillota bacterium]